PAAVLAGGTDEQAFRQWRADCIRALVQRIGRQTRAARPELQLSAAVFPNAPSAKYDVGQDWPAWMRAGELDFICPMIYTDSLATFRRQVEDGVHACGSPARMRPGIGASADRMQLRPDQVLAQLDAARQAGAGGAVIFSLNAVARRDLLPLLNTSALRSGTTSK
ncbi:MAG: family 10 glycosylhydrolase, partial [bacterium]